jgi:transposase
VRELVRAPEAAMEHLRCGRHHPQSFLLRHGRVFTGRCTWTKTHTLWLCKQTFDHPAQHLAFEECRQAVDDAKGRLDRLTRQVTEAAGTRNPTEGDATWLPVVERL